MSDWNPELCGWLTSSEGARWLDQLTPGDLGQVPTVNRLQRALSAEKAALLLETIRLRERAQARFPAAARMFFTAKSLQQATDPLVAAWKATRFPDSGVVDLGCGIGGDLIELARQGSATGWEIDPCLATFAAANCRAVLQRAVTVTAGDGEHCPLHEFSAWHADPDRRAGGSRTVDPRYFEPGRGCIDRWLARLPHGALKVAPATPAVSEWCSAAERTWIGRGSECVQQVYWFGSLAQAAGKRSVCVLHALQEPALWLETNEPARLLAADECDAYLYEPHAAVLAAGLVADVAQHFDLRSLTTRGGYLTAAQRSASPFLKCYEVKVSMSFDRKRLKRWLREHDAGLIDVKKRGVEHDPQQIARTFRGQGHQRYILVLYPRGRSVRVAICQPCES